MPVRVLIVDDSGFFRKRIAELLQGDSRIVVVGTAQNGFEGVEQVKSLKPDVVTMDVEMPRMNGIEAVRTIMQECPTNIMMLSSITHEGAQVTLQALEAGAVDYLSKDMRAWMDKTNSLRDQLREKVVALGRYRPRVRSSFTLAARSDQAASTHSKTMVFRPDNSGKAPAKSALKPTTPSTVAANKPRTGRLKRPSRCRLVVIGSSTGGPAALQKILVELPKSFPYPILLIQHMPKTFTAVFAERLDQQCQITVKEAQDGDLLRPGVALLAPGGHQLIVDGKAKDRVRVLPGDERLTYRPSVDVTYASAANTFGADVQAIILTGMGADGCEGAKILHQVGATVWAQNKESSTIFGMPQAVINAGLADEILDLSEIGTLLGQR